MTAKQFQDLLRDIEPSATTKAASKAGHASLRDHLRTDAEFSKLHKETFLSGSYKRNTAIRPQTADGETARPDVDIIVVTAHSLGDSPPVVVDQLYDALKRKYDNIRKQARSVGVFTAGCDMDVVPIIDPGDGRLYIPDRKQECWLETNPPRHTAWTTDVNADAGGRFKPLVKLFKWWRRENPTIANKPKGFVIECIVAECMNRDEERYDRLVAQALAGVDSRYRALVDAGIVPTISDPGVSSNSVTAGMSIDAFRGFCNKARDHSEIARAALDCEDEEKATALWRQIFGSRFPSTGSGKSALLKDAAEIGGLSFPNRPVAPNKPGGFA